MRVPSKCRNVFIVGCPRSGTSWLSNMLGAHGDVIQIREESWVYKYVYEPFEYIHKFNFRRRIRNRKWLTKRYPLRAILLGIQSKDLWDGLLKEYVNGKNGTTGFPERHQHIGIHNLVSEQDFSQLVQATRKLPEKDLIKARRLIVKVFEQCFLGLDGQPHQVLLEKTPDHVKRVNLILADFPNAKVIEIIRDGRDVCASFQSFAKTQPWAQTSTADIIQLWQKYTGFGSKFRQDPSIPADRFISVKYEELRQNPTAELAKLLDYIGLNSTPEVVRSIVDTHDIRQVKVKGEGQHVNQGIVGRWRHSLSADDITLWEQLAGEDLKQLGY